MEKMFLTIDYKMSLQFGASKQIILTHLTQIGKQKSWFPTN